MKKSALISVTDFRTDYDTRYTEQGRALRLSFKFEPLEIEGLILVSQACYHDDRGFFQESYREETFIEAGIPAFVQDNHARSRLNVLRGLHYQLNPMSQGKLVRCIRGRIFDVAVDIRKGSPTYGQWYGLELSEGNQQMLFIPEGFAHGYCALTADAEVLYKTTRYWSAQHERTIRWDDPKVGVLWPLSNPVLSDKDRQSPDLYDAENNFSYAQYLQSKNPR